MTGLRAEEIVIVGSGLAGSAVASTLSQVGRSTLLIERDAEPRHKVCGEFLSVEAQTYLAHLGIDLDTLGASRIDRLRLCRGRRMVQVKLPFPARGLSRKILDETLLRQALASGSSVLRGTSVRSISMQGPRIRLDAGHSEILAKTLFLATGKHDVRGAKRAAIGSMDDLIGFKAHYALDETQRLHLDGNIEVTLFTGGYAGLQMVDNGVANLCLVVTRRRFEELAKSWDNLLDSIARDCPTLGDRLHGAVALFERPLAIFQIPYGFLHTPHAGEPQGLFRVGDQAGVIPSFTGDGMSIALHSGCLAAKTYLEKGQAGAAFHNQVQADIRRQIRLAFALNKTVRGSAGQHAVFHLCRAWPAVMRHVATLTRIQESSMHKALFAT